MNAKSSQIQEIKLDLFIDQKNSSKLLNGEMVIFSGNNRIQIFDSRDAIQGKQDQNLTHSC